ncbi:OmpA/MotB family protein, partial [Sedimenticola sp.]
AASDYTLSIEGHTDPTPIANAQFPSNWELSAQRATGVLRFLLTQGVAASRMRAVGHADTRPLADNATAEGRARNRRVALILQRAEE